MDIKETYIRFYKPLVAFSNKILNDIDKSESVVQNCFVKLHFSKIKLNDENNIQSYLYRSVKNICINELRNKKVRDSHSKSMLIEHTIDIRDEIIRHETYNELYLAIEKLPEQTKKVILLSLKEYQQKEIAENLNISVESVKTLKKLAITKLKGHLKDYLFTYLCIILEVF